MSDLARQVATVIASHLYRFDSESALQEGIHRALDSLEFGVEREAILGPGERLDFFVDGRVAVEVKIKGSAAELTRQVYRYAQRPEVEAVVVVTSRSRLTALPVTMADKPIIVVYLVESCL